MDEGGWEIEDGQRVVNLDAQAREEEIMMLISVIIVCSY